MRKLEQPPRLDLAFQARTDRSLALTKLAVQSSRACIDASMKLLVRVDPHRNGEAPPPSPSGTPRPR
ncbi:hypothetical protein [Methylobacterium soli]|uniref:Uncharacterized protein n=1 Tax=Methylobacterium soli TaxID=553447 RepID=A0A6L3T0J9_9HYPH|nr:hypothetical protein [Methylobacterium soli]KAB1080036.1 hypothetical protein F6X53_07305 [Methylobacterium soli]